MQSRLFSVRSKYSLEFILNAYVVSQKHFLHEFMSNIFFMKLVISRQCLWLLAGAQRHIGYNNHNVATKYVI